MNNSLEWIAIILSVLGIILTAKGSIKGWIISLPAAILYSIIFYINKLFVDMALQFLFCITIIYGLIFWKKTSSDRGFKSSPYPLLKIIRDSLLTLIISILLGWKMSQINDSSPYMDSILGSFSILAQYWTAKKYAASWIVWIIIDINYSFLFFYKALYPTMFLYIMLVFIAIYGWMKWINSNTKKIKH